MVKQKNVVYRTLSKVEDELAGICSPVVWLVASAPESVRNAITSLMPALVILFVFHALLVAGGGTDGWFHAALMQTVAMFSRVAVVPIG